MDKEKDFDGWNKQKKLTQEKLGDVDFHEREIWCCSIGMIYKNSEKVIPLIKAAVLDGF